MMENYFVELNSVNVNDKTEKKNGLTYLSWSFCWGEVKKRFPDTTYTVYENADGWNYFTDGRTAWVKTGVTINGIEHIEYLPVMDFRNKSIPLENITSFDVNKAIQRSLTKACARHGIGLYIYAGEDLPEGGEDKKAEVEKLPITPIKVKVLQQKVEQWGTTMDALCKLYRVEKPESITELQFRHICEHEKEIVERIGKHE